MLRSANARATTCPQHTQLCCSIYAAPIAVALSTAATAEEEEATTNVEQETAAANGDNLEAAANLEQQQAPQLGPPRFGKSPSHNR